METKVCTKCGRELPLSDFYNNKSKKDGKTSECKYCYKEYSDANKEKIKDYKKEYNKEYYEKNKERKKEYKEKNKEKFREYQKEYYENNKERRKEYDKEYRENNKEKLKEYIKKYQKNNKEKLKEYQKEYQKNNKEKLKEYNKEYYENNKERRKEYCENNKEKINKYYRNRRKEDELFAVTCRCRRRIQNFIKKSGYKKTSKTFEMIGCTPEQLVEHLHKTWYDNYGTEYNGEPVHIDHIIPLSSAKTEEDIYKLCHYSNMQYLKPEDNLAKSDSILQTI